MTRPPQAIHCVKTSNHTVKATPGVVTSKFGTLSSTMRTSDPMVYFEKMPVEPWLLSVYRYTSACGNPISYRQMRERRV